MQSSDDSLLAMQVQRFILAEFLKADWTITSLGALDISIFGSCVLPNLIATGVCAPIKLCHALWYSAPS